MPYGAVRAGDYQADRVLRRWRVELYNLRDDVGEQHDLADRDARARRRNCRTRCTPGGGSRRPDADAEPEVRPLEAPTHPDATASAGRGQGEGVRSRSTRAGMTSRIPRSIDRSTCDGSPSEEGDCPCSAGSLLSACSCPRSQRLSFPAAGAAERPNILMMLSDDLGYGDLACYGHPVIKTPHLDGLAAQGLRLKSYYSAASICSPARAGLMTGRTPQRVGVHNWIIPARRCTCAAARSRSRRCSRCRLCHLPCRQVAPERPLQSARAAAAGRSRLRSLVLHAEQRGPDAPEPEQLRPQRDAARRAGRLFVATSSRRRRSAG